MRIGFAVITVGFTMLATSFVQAQDARLGRLPEAARAQDNGILDEARTNGLPTEPLMDRALEAVAKGAPTADAIVRSVMRLRDELRVARSAFGVTADPEELKAGASALRAGATREDLAKLHALRPGQKLNIAAGVLADMVAAGVPADTGIAAVLALAPVAKDADYAAFRRNVERDIALGASPAAAIGVRLQAAMEMADAPPGFTSTSGGNTKAPPRKRKP